MLIVSCLSYTKFEIIQLPREEPDTKSNLSSKMLLQVLKALTLQLLIDSLKSVFSAKHM